MKKTIAYVGQTVKNHWRELMASTHRRMSRGAQNLNKIITFAHGDNWRRKEKKK